MQENRKLITAALCSFSLFSLLFPSSSEPFSLPGAYSVKRARSVNVATQGYGASRTGANLNETLLTPSNVNPAQFGKLFTRSVDGFIYAQPLVMSGVTIAGKGIHNVVFIATEHDSVYAFDADDPNATAPLWRVSLGTPVQSYEISPAYNDLVPEIGITSTPVIDPGTGTMYVVAKTKDGSGYHQALHALDISTGNEKFGGPVEIKASAQSTAPDSTGGILNFNPLTQLNRPALLLSNGLVYVAFGSHEDLDDWHGWVMAYDAATLRQTAVFCTTPDGYEAGIWGAGQGVTADSNGNIYVATGNGSYYANGPSGGDFGDSVIKLSPNLSVIDWFAPEDQESLDKSDMDLGSGAPLLLPGTNLLVICGKDGVLRLIDANSMGRFDPSVNDDQQELPAVTGKFMGRPVYWDSPNFGPAIYIWGESDFLKEYRFTNSRFQSLPVSQGTVQAAIGYSNSPPLTLSANGSQSGTGIVWASCPDRGDANHQTVHGVLRAFDASDLSRELWNSMMNPGRDDVGNYAKFCPPVVANGKVYEASFSGVLNVYGLLGSGSEPQSISIDPASASFGTAGGAGNISVNACSGCSWTASSSSDWITLSSASGPNGNVTGVGRGAIGYSVDLNESPSRVGTITISGSAGGSPANYMFSISQTSGCWFAVDPASQNFGPVGGTGSVSITGGPGCPWTAASNVPWITITSSVTGTGSSTVSFSVKRKKKNRTGTLTIGGETVTISQQKSGS